MQCDDEELAHRFTIIADSLYHYHRQLNVSCICSIHSLLMNLLELSDPSWISRPLRVQFVVGSMRLVYSVVWLAWNIHSLKSTSPDDLSLLANTMSGLHATKTGTFEITRISLTPFASSVLCTQSSSSQSEVMVVGATPSWASLTRSTECRHRMPARL